MNQVDKTLNAVKRLDDTPDLVDIMISIEDYLDRNDIHAYKNWSLGELIDGPYVKQYWIYCTFKWPYKKMPDPTGGMRLLPHGTRVVFKKTKENVPQPIKEPSDYEPGTHKPKIKSEPVWIVELMIPRRFIEDLKDEVMNMYDDRHDDIDTASEAEAEGSTEENIQGGELGNI